jgi:hypothetical protein
VTVALVVLMGQAAAWVHAATTTHVTCLEHGDSVHLAAARAPGPIPTGPGLAAVGATTSESEAHGHEHCGLQGQRTATTSATVRHAATLADRPLLIPAITSATPTLQLLRLAPKTSPPRAPVV